MSKIKEYIIGKANGTAILANAVQANISTGWQPYGYPFMDEHGSWCQPMVKYESN